MIVKTYKCDLCQAIRALRDLVPIYWKTGGGRAVIARDVSGDAGDEHHLCPECIEQIKQNL